MSEHDPKKCWTLLGELDVWTEIGLFATREAAVAFEAELLASDSRVKRTTILPPSDIEVEA